MSYPRHMALWDKLMKLSAHKEIAKRRQEDVKKYLECGERKSMKQIGLFGPTLKT